MKLVESNLKGAQRQQSVQYNQNAKQRVFVAGDLVPVSLPTTQDKLLAKWQGPYRVVEKKGRVNYLIDMHDHQKRKRVFHINLLKKWETPVSEDCYEAQEVDDVEDLPDWRTSTSGPAEAWETTQKRGERGHSENVTGICRCAARGTGKNSID